MLHIVLGEVERTPPWLHFFAFDGIAGLAHVAPFGSAEVAEILLGLMQAYRIAAAWHERETQLREIILPAADRTDLVEPGHLVVHQVTTAGTGKPFRTVSHQPLPSATRPPLVLLEGGRKSGAFRYENLRQSPKGRGRTKPDASGSCIPFHTQLTSPLLPEPLSNNTMG